MKKIVLLLSVLFFAFTIVNVSPVVAQTTKKEKKAMKKVIKKRALKEARKEAKKFKKQGYNVKPGSLPMDKILEQAWYKQLETDDKGNPKYITADGSAVAGNETAAELQAIETGKLQLAGLLETRIAGLVSTNIATEEFDNLEAESVTEIISNSKNIISKNLGYINPIFKIFRRLDNGNVQTYVKLAYNAEEADALAKKAIKKELKEKLKANEEDLRKLMGM